jgi:phospholipase/lecithinase/hemolysin
MQPLVAGSLDDVALIAPGALFVVWGGPDDFLSPSPLDATPTAVADRAVANLAGIVAALQGIGAHRILVPGMPDLGLTPRVRSLGPGAAAQASALTDYFNAGLLAALPAGVTYFDTAGLLRSMVSNPAAYGFTNVVQPCLAGGVCTNPDQYLFWDDIHPTARAHEILGEDFAGAAIPEPGSLALVIAGAVLLGAVRRLRSLKSS